MTEIKKLRFGILGCGVIGSQHAQSIVGLDEAELVAVADVVAERASSMADEYGCSRYADL